MRVIHYFYCLIDLVISSVTLTCTILLMVSYMVLYL